MISFNNKFISIISILILLYMLSNTFGGLSSDMAAQSQRMKVQGAPMSSKNSIYIDPSKSTEDLTFSEKMAIKLLAPDIDKKIAEAKKQQIEAKDYVAALGDKVFFEMSNSEETTSYTAVLGEESKYVSNETMTAIIGMKINDIKTIDGKQLKVLFIERKENR